MVGRVVAYIRHIPPAQAGGRLAQVYKEIRAEVPRVPNFMQALSLRPETMEGAYRLWISLMWSGRVPRPLKEAIAVCVARAARCDYCADAHLIYMLATGMDTEKAWGIAAHLDQAEHLIPAEREALQFAVRLTRDPRSVRKEQRAAFAAGWPTIEQRVELAAVIASFNSVTRLANALGVASEIPSPLLRFEAGRRSAIAMLARLTAMSLDLSEKPIPAEPPENNRLAMRQLFLDQLGFASMPPGYELMEACPEVFDGQLRTIRKAVAVMPRDRFMRVGLVVSRLTGCEYFAIHCGEWLASRGELPGDVIAASEGSPCSLPDCEHACLRFARDFSLHSHTLGEERTRELRRLGLSDGAILDLAYVAATFHGMVRLVLALSPF